jgi:hypothetical protein
MQEEGNISTLHKDNSLRGKYSKGGDWKDGTQNPGVAITSPII